MFNKQLDAQASVSIAESVQLEQQESPQREAARVKKDADELEGERQERRRGKTISGHCFFRVEFFQAQVA